MSATDTEPKYYFTLTVTKRQNGTARFIEVEVYDPDDSDPVALPIATATAPAYGVDGLERAVQRAFSELQLPDDCITCGKPKDKFSSEWDYQQCEPCSQLPESE